MRISPKGILQSALGVFIFIICTTILLQLWNADLSVPFGYYGDFISASTFIKTVIDQGWYITNPMLGAPFELNMNDYPLGGDNFNFLLIKIISLFTNNYAVVTNIFYLLSFLLAYLTSYFVMRYLKINFVYAILGSLLFTFLPFHFFRANGGHIFLACYYMIPLVTLVSFWIFEKRDIVTRVSWKKYGSQNVISFIISILIASTGIYYAFFACFFWIVAAIYASINRREKAPLLNGIILTSVVIITLILNNISTIISKIANPKNLEAVYRSPIEAEILSLKINQLFMPILGHRLTFFDNISQKYARVGPLVNENHMVALGILGSIGFMILIVSLLVRNEIKCKKIEYIQQMGILNISAVLLACTGGFGFIVAALITPAIRGYNRISPYIGFMAVLSLIIILQLMTNRVQRVYNKKIIISIFVLLLSFGILDQTSNSFVPDYKGLGTQFSNDKDFYESIEKKLSNGSMVFQLPYIPFPEHPWVHNMGNYDHLKAYLHTSSIAWSFGAMRGSPEDLAIRNMSSKTGDELLHAISIAGYEGVVINRDGYTDLNLEQYIIETTKGDVFYSNDKKLVFIDIRTYSDKLKGKIGTEEWGKQYDSLVHPVLLSFGKGVYDLESNKEMDWRWSEQNSEITIMNLSNRNKKMKIEGRFVTPSTEKSELEIYSDSFKDQLLISISSEPYSRVFELPPNGEVKINFTTNSSKVNAVNDPRNLYFQIQNFKYTVID